MDKYTCQHLRAWIVRNYQPGEWVDVYSLLYGFVREYPDMLKTHSWRELRDLAERK